MNAFGILYKRRPVHVFRSRDASDLGFRGSIRLGTKGWRIVSAFQK